MCPDLIFPVFLLLAMAASIRLKVISGSGAAAGGLVAIGLYLGGGWTGVLLLGIFLVTGSVATRWQKDKKQSLGLAQEADGQRTWLNAAANGGVGGLLGLLAWISGWEEPLAFPMMASSIASATSDTLSSELGNLYGRRYRNILNWRTGIKGQDGVISLEGTLFGVAGSVLVAAPVAWHTGALNTAVIVAVAGLTGNIADSFLGATLQRAGRLNNHSVNFYSTVIAALAAWLLYNF